MKINTQTIYWIPETRSVIFRASFGKFGPESWEEIRASDLEVLAQVLRDQRPLYPQEQSLKKGM